MTIPEKYKHIDFSVTKEMKDSAKRGLEYRKKNKGKGGLSTQDAGESGIGSGVARARDIINKSKLPPGTWKRIHNFFTRHEKNIKIDKGKSADEDAGYIAGLTWGGSAAASRARKIVRQMEIADKKEKLADMYFKTKKTADLMSNEVPEITNEDLLSLIKRIKNELDNLKDFIKAGFETESSLDAVSKELKTYRNIDKKLMNLLYEVQKINEGFSDI